MKYYYEYEPEDEQNMFIQLNPLERFDLIFNNIPPTSIIDYSKCSSAQKSEIKTITAFQIDFYLGIEKDLQRLFNMLHLHLNQYLSGQSYKEMIKVGYEIEAKNRTKKKELLTNLLKRKMQFNIYRPITIYNWLFKSIPPALARKFDKFSSIQQKEIKAITAYNMNVFGGLNKDEVFTNRTKIVRYIKWDLESYFNRSLRKIPIATGNKILNKNKDTNNVKKRKKRTIKKLCSLGFEKLN